MSYEPAIYLTNKYGNEVAVTRTMYKRAKSLGAKFSRRTIKHVGSGNEKDIALLLSIGGMGDDIHAMPAISQKIKEGYNVTVFTREYSSVCYSSLGCTVVTDKNEIIESELNNFIRSELKNYGIIYSLANWSGEYEFYMKGKPPKSRFQQFAEFIDTTLPEEFSWKGLQVQRFSKEPNDKIVYHTDSTSPLRAFKDSATLLWLMQEHGLNVISYPQRKSFALLCYDIYNAELVVAVDSGILALALAFGVPCLALLTDVSDGTTITQYEKYLPNATRMATYSTDSQEVFSLIKQKYESTII